MLRSDNSLGTNPRRRDFLRGLGIAGAAVALGGLSGSAGPLPPPVTSPSLPAVERRSTFYTSAKISAARVNIAKYPWAAAMKRAAVSGAAKLVAATDEWVWSALSGQGLPRSYAVNQDLGSPITGHGLYKYGAYAWQADPFGKPWKLKDPSSGYTFPTNDFDAFYRSGLDQHGNFNRSLADRRLLVNTSYPERGPTWGVDDGFGWVDDTGDKWTFIAYYVHWFLWYGGLAFSALQAARDAYLYTGAIKYAHTGLILLDRVADLYPAMDTAPYRREDGYLNSGALTPEGEVLGKAVGNIWEAELARNLASCYDAFYPAIAKADAAGVVGFLSRQSRTYGLRPKNSTADIRANIEHGILRQVYTAVKNARIRGNFGMHQSALAMAAVALDDPATTKAWIDFVFKPGELISEGAPARLSVTGGDVGPTLVDAVDRDGWGAESPGYNQIWIDEVARIADILDGYAGYSAVNLYKHPKFKALVNARPTLTMLGSYTPSIGDSGQVGSPAMLGTTEGYVSAFVRYRDPTLAQAAFKLNKNSSAGLHTGIFDTQPESAIAAIQQIVDARGPLRLSSRNLTGYGFAAMRGVTTTDGHEAFVYYGETADHTHRDDLMLDVFGFGLDLASPLGYPEFLDGRALTVDFQTNTISSNTVVVDKQPQVRQYTTTCQPRDFLVTPSVQMADIEAPKVYHQTSRYRRTTAMVAADSTNTYYVDIFRVRGGSEHVFSFHTIGSAADVHGVSLAAQPTGSYAGVSINPPADNAPGDRRSSGYEWLTTVSRGTPRGQFSVDWSIPDLYKVNSPALPIRLRLTMVGDVDELALADGRPARNKAAGNPATVRYMLAKRTGTALSSQFVSVIEPYNAQPFIRRITRVQAVATVGGESITDEDLSAVRVELRDGRVDYVISNLRPEVNVTVDNAVEFKGEFGVICVKGPKVVHALTSNATRMVPLTTSGTGIAQALQGLHGSIRGTVVNYSRNLADESFVTLLLSTPVPAGYNLVGKYVYMENDGQRNAAYEITGVSAGAGPEDLTIRVRGSTVRSYVNDARPASGYVYDVAAGAGARIPIVRSWTAG